MIKLFRLQSGEQVIAEILSETELKTTVKNPIALVPSQDGNVNFVPWTPLAEKDVEVEVYTSTMVYMTIPAEELVQNYEEIFSPIITPGKKGLIL